MQLNSYIKITQWSQVEAIQYNKIRVAKHDTFRIVKDKIGHKNMNAN